METRNRLMEAAFRLLQARSAMTLTTTAIAHEAKTSLATFYVYFGDVADIMLALADKASADIDDILGKLDAWDPNAPDGDGARMFVDAYRAYWDRHRAVLVLRNMESDRGDARFVQMRNRSGIRIVRALAEKIMAGQHGKGLTHEQTMARAMVFFAALERLSTRETLHDDGEPALREALNQAQIDILEGLVSG